LRFPASLTIERTILYRTYSKKELKREGYASTYKDERLHNKERGREREKEKEKYNYKEPSTKTRTRNIQCFKCLERGHYSSECP